MQMKQIYHEDIPKQEEDTIFQELKKVKGQIQEIQADLGRIEGVLFELRHLKKENDYYIKSLFNNIHQPLEVRLFYELSHKYEVLCGRQLTHDYIFKDYISLYRLISSNIVNLRAYEDILVQFYFKEEKE